MRSMRRTIATIVGSGFLAAACSGAGATPTPPTATPPPAGPTQTVAPPTTAPTPTTVPMTDGQGPEHFTGIVSSGPLLEVPYSKTAVGKVVQYRGGVAGWDFTTSDPRMKGHARLSFSIDGYGTVGPEWGTLDITDSAGTWSGPCTAASWDTGAQTVMGCWLAGAQAYAGFTAYYGLYQLSNGTGGVEGIIYPGSPPKL